jgi:hypothetical protein
VKNAHTVLIKVKPVAFWRKHPIRTKRQQVLQQVFGYVSSLNHKKGESKLHLANQQISRPIMGQ